MADDHAPGADRLQRRAQVGAHVLLRLEGKPAVPDGAVVAGEAAERAASVARARQRLTHARVQVRKPLTCRGDAP